MRRYAFAAAGLSVWLGGWTPAGAQGPPAPPAARTDCHWPGGPMPTAIPGDLKQLLAHGRDLLAKRSDLAIPTPLWKEANEALVLAQARNELGTLGPYAVAADVTGTAALVRVEVPGLVAHVLARWELDGDRWRRSGWRRGPTVLRYAIPTGRALDGKGPWSLYGDLDLWEFAGTGSLALALAERESKRQTAWLESLYPKRLPVGPGGAPAIVPVQPPQTAEPPLARPGGE